MTIKELVAKDNQVRFLYYRKKELWYSVIRQERITLDGRESPFTKAVELLRFPVPIEDTGDGTFLAEDRAITFMRYIRKQLEQEELERQPCEVQMRAEHEARVCNEILNNQQQFTD